MYILLLFFAASPPPFPDGFLSVSKKKRSHPESPEALINLKWSKPKFEI